MNTLSSLEYWNKIGSTKEFEDPLYLEKLSPYLTQESKIIEYGCGYGRMMQILLEHGYNNLTGYDFAQNMVKRGNQTHPHLEINLLNESGKIPVPNESVDAAIMLTVLCSMTDTSDQAKLLNEIWRILKPNGLIYISDFLICENERYNEMYLKGFQKFGKWGTYLTSENLVVRHLSSQALFVLMKNFDIQWFEQFDFKTMNNNPARTFHCIAIKKSHELSDKVCK
ncbi:MAG: class I SAM-dependent methyltransferase [Parachlamydiaceae bacterium]|nr:class I SAM-dependent methyltransferase [Parachlamydiaceae bacterium]